MYYDFTAGCEVPNYHVPRESRTVRVTTARGDLIPLGRRQVRYRYRIQYKKVNFTRQLQHAFQLFDHSLHILETVRPNLPVKNTFCPILTNSTGIKTITGVYVINLPNQH